MSKLKSLNFAGVLSIIKSALLGVIFTLIGVVIFSVILKFVDVSSALMSYINDAIKAVSIFLMVLNLKRKNGDKLLIKSIFSGLVYAIISFVVFSLLNGSFMLDISFVFDLLFSVAVSAIVSVIVNVLNRKAV